MSEDRVTVAPQRLQEHCMALLQALGVAPEDAAATAEVFVSAEQGGEESHGIRLLLHVLGRLEAGGDRAATRIDVIAERGAVAVWDANRSLGQVVATRAMRDAMARARTHGFGLVTVRNGNSLTSAKHYPLMAAEARMVGLAFTNTSRKLMAPEGGRLPVLGNNPMAVAAPARGRPPFVLDMAMTRAAVERIVQAKEQGRPIPEGWALDERGEPTTDPEAALASMALLPFGGYKAFGLGLAVEILTSGLSGGPLRAGDATGFIPYDRPMHTSFTLIAIDVAAFMPLEAFEERIARLLADMEAVPPRPVAGPVLVPGARSAAERARRREGIPLARASLDGLRHWADKLSIAPLIIGGATDALT